MPLSYPIRGLDGTYMTEIAVPKDTAIIVGIRSSNLSAKLWGDDVKEWKPDRWLAPLPQAVEDAHLPAIYSNQYVPVSTISSPAAKTVQDDVYGWWTGMLVSSRSYNLNIDLDRVSKQRIQIFTIGNKCVPPDTSLF